MAATVDTQPASPAAAYRPLEFTVLRADPSGSEVLHIYVADSTLASTLGIEVGQVVVKHATIIGSVPAVAGQTMIFYRNCGAYGAYVSQYGKGIFMILDEISSGGFLWMVIDAPDLGDFTPSGSPTAALRMWLNNYTVFCRVSVYTDPAEDPVEVDLKGTPDTAKKVVFDVSKVVQNYFNSDLSPYCMPVGGGELVQTAHAVSALFYEVKFAEVYDTPDNEVVLDPFDGTDYTGSDVFYTDTDYRVAVNAVHPSTYTDEVIDSSTPATLDWSTADLSDYEVGGGPDIGQHYVQKFLTHMPRRRTMGSGDFFRLHMLTNHAALLEVPKWTVDFLLVVHDYSTGADGGTVLEQAITLNGETAAFSVAVGPADLAEIITVPSRYRIYIGVDNTTGDLGPDILRYSELVDITVDSECRETSRPIIMLNPMGGVDSFSFTARELDYAQDGESFYTASARGLTRGERQWLVTNLMKRGKVATLQKGYASGTGYDYTERAYKGAVAFTRLSDTIVAPVIIETTSSQAASTGSLSKPLIIDFRIGRDQISQQG